MLSDMFKLLLIMSYTADEIKTWLRASNVIEDVKNLQSLCISSIKEFCWRIAACAVIHVCAADEGTRQRYDLNTIWGDKISGMPVPNSYYQALTNQIDLLDLHKAHHLLTSIIEEDPLIKVPPPNIDGESKAKAAETIVEKARNVIVEFVTHHSATFQATLQDKEMIPPLKELLIETFPAAFASSKILAAAPSHSAVE